MLKGRNPQIYEFTNLRIDELNWRLRQNNNPSIRKSVNPSIQFLRGPFAVYRASTRLSSRRLRVQMNSAFPNSFV